MKMFKYTLLFFILMQPGALALDKDRATKQKGGVEVEINSANNSDKVSIYYEIEAEKEDYMLTLELRATFKEDEEIYEGKVEVEF